MQGTPFSDMERPDTAPLCFLFYLLEPVSRQEIITEALEARSHVAPELRNGLNQAIKNTITLPGFRNSSLALAALLAPQLDESVQHAAGLACQLAKVWFASQRDLRDAAMATLTACGAGPEGSSLPVESVRVGYPSTQVAKAFQAYREANPEEDPKRATLMFQLLTGLTDIDREPERCEATVVTELLTATLTALRGLPATSPVWEDSALEFTTELANLVQLKQEQREHLLPLHDLMEAMLEEHGPIAEFFQWDLNTWDVDSIGAETNTKRAYDEAAELNDLLAQYAPIHERAPVVDEELKRAEMRLVLVPRIMEVAGTLQRLFDGEDAAASDEGQEAQDDAEPGCSNGPESGGKPVSLSPVSVDHALKSPTLEVSLPEELITYIPYCDIDSYLGLRSSYLDLEQVVDDMDQDNDDLRAEIKALEHQLYERRNQEESLRWAVAYRHNPDNPEEPEEAPDLQNVSAAVELAMARYPGQLLFELNADSDAVENSFKWPEQVWKALQWLATDYFASHLGDTPIPDIDEACRRACGMWYKTSQHENTMTQYRNSYTTRVDGRLIWLGEHIGKGNSFDPRRTIRIAFDWDRQLRKVVIGYIGQHQRSAVT